MSRHDEAVWRSQIANARTRRGKTSRRLSRHYRRLRPYRAWDALHAIKVALVSALTLVAITEIIQRLAV